jgi:hypothetical protein
MSVRQYLRSCQSCINLTIHRVSEFKMIKLIKSFIKTSWSNTTLLPCLNETTKPELDQKSAIV